MMEKEKNAVDAMKSNHIVILNFVEITEDNMAFTEISAKNVDLSIIKNIYEGKLKGKCQ